MGLLAGNVAFVTGGANGIGRAAALCFAREGAVAVVVADVDAAAGQRVADEIERGGVHARFVLCDVSDEASVARAVASAIESFGRLDCAYNNAGLGHGQVELAAITAQAWNRTVAVNLTGTWLCLKHQLPVMADAGKGAVVNQSSSSGVLGRPLVGGYGATKAAISHLTKVASSEYAARGVRVNAIAPGPIATDMVRRAVADNRTLSSEMLASVPMGRLGEPDEVAEAAAWLLSDRASYVTGVTLAVDGGKTVRGY